MYDVTRPSTFKSIDKWFDLMQEHGRGDVEVAIVSGLPRLPMHYFDCRLEINAICEATKKSTQSPEKISPLNLVVIFMNRVRKV